MPISEYAMYPSNDTSGMQQAWRLFFDEKNLKRGESYEIKKNHPKECQIMFRRALVHEGMIPENQLNEEQISYIEQKFVELLDLAFENPRLAFTASCVYLGGMTAAVVFFCQYTCRQVSL
jgi:hypothetical protein